MDKNLINALNLNDKDVISFVGAGGKSSLISSIATELIKAKKSVCVVALTGIKKDFPNAKFIIANEIPNIIQENFARNNKVPVFAGEENNEKVFGAKPAWIDELKRQFNFLLLESDGAKGKCFKIPRGFEPVSSPLITHQIVCVNINAINKPISDELCFNIKGIAETGIVREGDLLTPEIASKLIKSSKKYANPMGNISNTLVVCGCSSEKLRLFDELVKNIRGPEFENIVSVEINKRPIVQSVISNKNKKVWLVILAAGKSSRFGSDKILLKYKGMTLIEYIVNEAISSNGCGVCVVANPNNIENIKNLLKGYAVKIILNEDYEKGMSESIKTAVKGFRNADAIGVIPADLPYLNSNDISSVIDVYQKSTAIGAFPLINKQRHSHPVIFDKVLFSQLLNLAGDKGGDKLLQANKEKFSVYFTNNDKLLIDIDSKNDYNSLINDI